MIFFPPLHPRALLVQNTCHVWVDGRVLVGGGGLGFGGAGEAAARTMQKLVSSEFEMAVDIIKGK
jgi:hypothetical protein